MRVYGLLLLIIILAGCTSDPAEQVLPTQAEPMAMGTSIVLTEFAPPAGYDTVSFPNIDDNLRFLSGWRYEMYFGFEGVFARTTRVASVSYRASVTYDQVLSARRVEATIDDNLEQDAAPIQFEGVALGVDTFLVRNGVCSRNTTDSEFLANFSAGDLLGGIQTAQTAAQRETINGEEVWRYAVLADDLILPNVVIGEEGRLLSYQSEIWVAPEHDAIIRYNLRLDVENATLFDQPLPITGIITLQYDLYDIGIVPNITVPNGC